MWEHQAMSNFSAQRRRAAIVVLAVGAALTLSGCAGAMDTQRIVDTTLHPTGSDGGWLSEAYRDGAPLKYRPGGYQCGMEQGLSVEWDAGEGVTARRMSDDSVVWHMKDAICLLDGYLPDVGLSIRSAAGDIELVELTTGDVIEAVPIPSATPPRPVMRAGAVTVYQTPTGLSGVADGAVAWTADLGAAIRTFPLDGGAIGVDDVAANEATLVDGATGRTLFTDTPVSKMFEWTSDGVALLVDKDGSGPGTANLNKSEYQFVDLTGAQVGAQPALEVASFIPAAKDGVTFTTADMRSIAGVVGVTADGKPALFQVGDDVRTPTGSFTLPYPKQTKIDDLAAVSADGTLLLFANGHRLTLVTAEGREIFSLPSAADPRTVTIVNGYIRINGADPLILLPAGG